MEWVLFDHKKVMYQAYVVMKLRQKQKGDNLRLGFYIIIKFIILIFIWVCINEFVANVSIYRVNKWSKFVSIFNF